MTPEERFTARAELRDQGGYCEPLTTGSLASADLECVHGRLSGDRTPPCGCFPLERAAAAAVA